jgi:uncharacterized protein DUF3373
MKRLIAIFVALLLVSAAAYAQSTTSTQDNEELRSQIEQLKTTMAALEARLAATEQKSALPAAPAPAPATAEASQSFVEQVQSSLKDLDHRVARTERKSAVDRINWSGEYRAEASSIFGHVPAHFDGLQLQNLMVRTLWLITPTSQGGLGQPFDPNSLPPNPNDFATFLGSQVQQNFSQYQFFSNNITYNALQQGFGQFTPAQQQALQQYLLGVAGVQRAAYAADANALLTNRLRLNFDAKVADNVSVTARLAMYKIFGDSTGVQVFNGQPTALAIDGTTVGVPSGDMLRVERAYFTWTNIGGSKAYFSVGRRPSTEGPPLSYRYDDPRGGTPSGALINYQFDGATAGYHLTEKTTVRACYGLGYDAGFGNGQLLQNPADRLRSVHFLGANVDLYNTDKTFIQLTAAKAWNVTDGFNGQIVLPNNPVTGDAIGAPVIMRFTPSTNLGNIFLYGVTASRKMKQFDFYGSMNWDSLRPNSNSSPFGGLGSDPFQPTSDHDGWMVYAGGRWTLPINNDGRTKIGFEYNHGSKYWFNFAQAEDDILQPKMSVRGNAYEAYFTHRINQRFIFKVDYQRFLYDWSGSGMQVGEPKRLSQNPVIGFPTYDRASLLSFGLNAKF